MKKALIIIIAIIICVSACIGASASAKGNNIISVGNTDVIFDENSSLSDDDKSYIAEHLVYGDYNVSTYGLICTLLGHNIITEGITTTTHCARDSAPRCLEQEWDVDRCTRCDYMDPILLSSFYIYCCD